MIGIELEGQYSEGQSDCSSVPSWISSSSAHFQDLSSGSEESFVSIVFPLLAVFVSSTSIWSLSIIINTQASLRLQRQTHRRQRDLL